MVKENDSMQHSDYMKLALKEAKYAHSLGDAPVGCVIVYDGQLIGRGHNTRETGHTALGHAEPVSYTHLDVYKRQEYVAFIDQEFEHSG